MVTLQPEVAKHLQILCTSMLSDHCAPLIRTPPSLHLSSITTYCPLIIQRRIYREILPFFFFQKKRKKKSHIYAIYASIRLRRLISSRVRHHLSRRPLADRPFVDVDHTRDGAGCKSSVREEQEEEVRRWDVLTRLDFPSGKAASAVRMAPP